ncbi:Protein MALE DISCOVERER 2, partial [Mucuna pruriens]
MFRFKLGKATTRAYEEKYRNNLTNSDEPDTVQDDSILVNSTRRKLLDQSSNLAATPFSRGPPIRISSIPITQSSGAFRKMLEVHYYNRRCRRLGHHCVDNDLNLAKTCGIFGQLQKAFITGIPKLNQSELNIINSFDECTVYKETLSIGYCDEEQPFTRMMVFEYTLNGNLFEHLHVQEVEHLDWSARMRIIMG